MNENLKFYGISFVGYFQYFIDLVNPFLSFMLLCLTILYTYQKYLKLKNENKNNNE